MRNYTLIIESNTNFNPSISKQLKMTYCVFPPIPQNIYSRKYNNVPKVTFFNYCNFVDKTKLEKYPFFIPQPPTNISPFLRHQNAIYTSAIPPQRSSNPEVLHSDFTEFCFPSPCSPPPHWKIEFAPEVVVSAQPPLDICLHRPYYQTPWLVWRGPLWQKTRTKGRALCGPQQICHGEPIAHNGPLMRLPHYVSPRIMATMNELKRILYICHYYVPSNDSSSSLSGCIHTGSPARHLGCVRFPPEIAQLPNVWMDAWCVCGDGDFWNCKKKKKNAYPFEILEMSVWEMPVG